MQTANAELERTADQSPDDARRDHLWFLESMDRVHRAVQGTHDLEQMMSDVLDVVLSIFNCDRALLAYPCDPEATSFQIPMRRTRPEFPCELALGVEYPVTDDVLRVYRASRNHDAPLQLSPQAEVPVPAQLQRDLGVRSALVMPVYPKKGKPYHFVLHQCSHVRTWTAAERRLFEEIGRRLADGLTTLLMLRDLARVESRLAEAERITHATYTERDLITGRVHTSDEGFRILGLEPGRQSITLEEALELIHPDDREMVLRRVSEARLGSYHDLEYRVIRPGGEVRVIHSRGEIVRDDSGRPARAVGVIQDVTEHKRAEYLTRQVFDCSPDGIAIVGSDFICRRANAVYEKTLHVPVGGAVGMHMSEILGPDLFENITKPNLERCFAGDEVKYANWVDYRFGHMYASVTYTPLHTHSERPDAALIVVSDLTEYMLAEEGLQKAQAELAHMARATTLAEIGSSIAHEINQPLAAIVMSGNACRRWLAGDPPDLKEARAAVKQIVDDGNRASEIVGRIRALLRGDEPVKQRLILNDVITETLALVRVELARQRIVVRAAPASDAATIVADRVQLQQVLVNLILNAADAMSSIPVEDRALTLRAHVTEGTAVVDIEDTGVGFAPHEAERIFDAFYSTKKHGLGMGLSISRSIVEAHGGRLWATPNAGQGVTFHFALPVVA